MQCIIIKKTVEVPNCPLFKEGQKVRIKDDLADVLVSRGLAVYDRAEKQVTEKAKKAIKVRKEEAVAKSSRK